MADEKVVKSGALIHGMYASDFLLPWDDRDEFKALHNALKVEYFPSGASEEECVFDLALAHWQKRTLLRLRTSTILRDPTTREILATKEKSWSGIRRGLRKKAREEFTVKKDMGEIFTTAFSELMRVTKKVKRDQPVEGDKELLNLLEAGLSLISQTVLPMLDEVRNIPSSEEALERNFVPDDLEKIIRLEAMIDARIAKILARLVGVKEFKRTSAGSPPKQLTKA